MTKIEVAALNTYLSDYPLGWSYEEVIQGIKDEDEVIIVWQPVEDYDPWFVVTEIESLKIVMTNLVECISS